MALAQHHVSHRTSTEGISGRRHFRVQTVLLTLVMFSVLHDRICSFAESSESSASSAVQPREVKCANGNEYSSDPTKLLLSFNISDEQTQQEEILLRSTIYPKELFSWSLVNVSQIIGEDGAICSSNSEHFFYMAEHTCALSMNFTLERREQGSRTKRITNTLVFLSVAPYVKALSLRNNSISDLPKNTFSNFTMLQALDLSMNKLIRLDLTEAPFQHLRKLALASNNLQALNILPFNLTSLDIDHNNLSNLSFLSNLTNLRLIVASHNNISYIPSKLFANLPGLRCLMLENNKITDVAFLLNIPSNNIYRIALSYNEIKEVNVDFTKCNKLKILELNNNNIFHFNFRSAVLLNHLNLCNNFISEITPTHPLRNSSMNHLKLCNNNLTSAAVIMLMKKLITLDLSNNQLHKVHKMFVNKRYLTKLFLSNVSLQSLEFVTHLKNLIVLEVDNNNITHFPKEIFNNIPFIKKFTLSNNPLEPIRCPYDEKGRNTVHGCNVPFEEEEDDHIILDIGKRNKRVNRNMECILNSSGKEFLNKCRSNLSANIRNLEKYILITVMFILKII